MPARLVALLTALVVLTGCGASTVWTSPRPTPVSPRPSVALPPAPPVRFPHTLPALMRTEDDGGDLRREKVLADNDAYRTYLVSYRSGDLRISGVLAVPHGAHHQPAIVLAHGYADPATYPVGGGFVRERDYLARSGYVVLHTDYRNYGDSERDPTNDRFFKLGFVSDVINAVTALRRSGLAAVDPDRIGLLGRSMGGGIALDVATVRPGLVSAVALMSPVSSNAVDDATIFTWPPDGQAQRRAALVAQYGEPVDGSPTWHDLSSRSFVDRVNEPLYIVHGTADPVCPPVWTEQTQDALEAAHKDVTVRWYRGEGHRFERQWRPAMRGIVGFFNTTV